MMIRKVVVLIADRIKDRDYGRGKKNIINRISIIVLLASIGAILVTFMVPGIVKSYRRGKQAAVIEKARTYFENEFPSVLRKEYEDFPFTGTLDIKAVSNWSNSSFRYNPVYVWEDTLDVTLQTDTSFDKLEEREKYHIINDFGRKGTRVYRNTMENNFPGYLSGYKLTAGAYDRTVQFRPKQNFYIKTPKCTYKFLDERDSYGIGTGGRVHRLTDPKSIYYVDPNAPKLTPKPTPRPTAKPKPLATYSPSKKSSLSGKETDPDEAHLYDDPDEYADRYAKEFAEEMGEDVDEGYMEAYDHWIYWHELHG